MNPSLHEKQAAFARLIFRLIDHAFQVGYEVTLGEAWRPPETAALYAKQGKGIKNSLHIQRLAIDLILFKDGKVLQEYNDYVPIGNYWKTLSTPGFECNWGGDFKSRDLGHFSISNEGIK